MKNIIKKILRESSNENKDDGLDWMREHSPYEFYGYEIWFEVDNYIEADILYHKLIDLNLTKDRKPSNSQLTKYVVLHCGMDENDFKPKKGQMCYLTKGAKENDEKQGIDHTNTVFLKKEDYWSDFF
jgi:hypothetical protein